VIDDQDGHRWHRFQLDRGSRIGGAGSDLTIVEVLLDPSGTVKNYDAFLHNTCVAEGVPIETPNGPVPVERLRLGHMLVHSNSPFVLGALEWWGPRTTLIAVASFAVGDGGVLQPETQQAGPQDRSEGGQGWSDFVPLKPACDLLVVGRSWTPPNGRSRVSASIEAPGFERSLVVRSGAPLTSKNVSTRDGVTAVLSARADVDERCGVPFDRHQAKGPVAIPLPTRRDGRADEERDAPSRPRSGAERAPHSGPAPPPQGSARPGHP
jgi:hypothetical protein